MKKNIALFCMSVVIVAMLVTVYQQHQLLQQYRGLLYGELQVLNVPIERLLAFHMDAASDDDATRSAKLQQLDETYADFFNYTGGGLQLEPTMREAYYTTYSDTKLAYAQLIKRYIEAASAAEREQVYTQLKETYERYQQFLQAAEQDLVEPV